MSPPEQHSPEGWPGAWLMCDLLSLLLFAVTALDSSGRVMDYFRVPWEGGAVGSGVSPPVPAVSLAGSVHLSCSVLAAIPLLCPAHRRGSALGEAPLLCAVLGVRSEPME